MQNVRSHQFYFDFFGCELVELPPELAVMGATFSVSTHGHLPHVCVHADKRGAEGFLHSRLVR